MSRQNNYRAWGNPPNVYENVGAYEHNQGFMPQPPFQAFPQRGGGRGRGRKRPDGKTRQPVAETAKPVFEPKKTEVPPPQHLSKTNSELKNDPLYEEAFFPSPSEELREISKESEIFPGCDGLMALIQELYLEMGARSFNYKRNVSISAHNYYFAILTYARLLHLRMMNKRQVTFDESQFVEQVIEHGLFEVPASFHKYLAGFGSTTLPSGVKQWFAMNKPDLVASDDDFLGYFGCIEDNPGAYSTYPCPGVFAQRIMEDLRYTLNPVNPEWDLPVPFNLEDAPINQNCIGYDPAVRVSSDQAQFFATKGIVDGDFGSNNASIPFNIRLMNGVQKYMAEISGIRTLPMPTNETGSQGQLVTVMVENFNRIPDRSTYIARAPLRIVGSIAYLGSSFMYKVKKDEYNIHDERRLWPNTFPLRDNPTQGYRQSFWLNSEGMDPKLDHFDYESTPFTVSLRLKHITSKDVVVKS